MREEQILESPLLKNVILQRERVAKHNYRKLASLHRTLNERIDKLARRGFLTSQESSELKILKLKRLQYKEQLAFYEQLSD